MKCGIVKLSDISRSPRLRLDAEYYIDPTKHIDEKIASLEEHIRKHEVSLCNLRSQRQSILDEKRTIPIHVRKP